MNPVRSSDEPPHTPEKVPDLPANDSGGYQLTFVELEESHLDTIMDIEREAYPEPWTISMFREEIKGKRSFFWTAFLEEKIVGYAGYWLVLDEAHVTSLTVAKPWRGHGYAYEQLRHLMDHIIASDAHGVTLEVRETNEVARYIYEKEGFEAVGKRKGYYSKTQEDAIIMLKKLSR